MHGDHKNCLTTTHTHTNSERERGGEVEGGDGRVEGGDEWLETTKTQ